MEKPKVGPKGRHANIPDDYEVVTSGNAQKGDSFIETQNGNPRPCEEDDIGMPFDTFDCLIRFKPFPRWTFHNRNGNVVAISRNLQFAPAYQNVPSMTVEEMRTKAQASKGYVMQQDDGMSPPFQLYTFTD